ncbi:MAG: M48 family metallopeptidase [Deltaproteobacteria bacterium]|nr:M48 family metallopeptidase [Deltaproteobacteria bacterium]
MKQAFIIGLRKLFEFASRPAKPALTIGFLLIFSALSLSGCAKDYVTGKSTLNYYSLSSDIELGNYVMAQQLKSLKQNDKSIDMEADSTELQRIRKIVKKIAAVSHIPTLPYEVHLADVDIVNAWCAPGGKMMVYTGLWQPRKGLVQEGNEDELAAVLAHEIAHATARHVTETISKATTFQMAGAVASAIITEAGSPAGSDLFQQIFYGGLNVYLPSYSRKNESEADAIGIIYMAAAGYNPQAAVNLWERAAKESKNDKTSIFASHPSSGERAKNLKKLLPKAMEVYKAALKTNPRKKKPQIKKKKLSVSFLP